MYSSASNNGPQISDDAGSKISNASRKVLNFFDHTGQEISHAKETVTTHIQQKPLRSTFLALGVGLIIGALVSR